MSEPAFICNSCNKIFKTKTGLTYHVSQKVCQKPDKTCSNCGKIFYSKRNLEYHTSQHVCTNRQTSFKPKIVLKSKYSEITKEELIIKLAESETKYQTLKDNPQHIDIVNNNNNIIVFPKEFGKEDMTYIQQKLGDVVGPLIKSHMFRSIPCLFNKIHNNQIMPEYHNVFSSSERSKYAMVSDGNVFKHQPKKNVIDQIIESKRMILKEYVDANGDQLGEKVLQKYERYTDLLDEDVEFRKNIELEIGGLLLDLKAVIANDEKTRKLLDKVNEGDLDYVEFDGLS